MIKKIIEVKDITKSFSISAKSPGMKGSLKHFFNRKTMGGDLKKWGGVIRLIFKIWKINY